MRRVSIVILSAVLTMIAVAAPASARPPCDPGACIDPVEVVERAACQVAYRLGFQCVD